MILTLLMPHFYQKEKIYKIMRDLKSLIHSTLDVLLSNITKYHIQNGKCEVDETVNSQKAPHSSPLWARYGVSSVSTLREKDIKNTQHLTHQTTEAVATAWWSLNGNRTDSPTSKLPRILLAKQSSILATQQARGCLRENNGLPANTRTHNCQQESLSNDKSWWYHFDHIIYLGLGRCGSNVNSQIFYVMLWIEFLNTSW